MGGVGIYGAIIAAFLSGWLLCKWRRVPVLPMFDLAAMGFLIGQCIGRWGNFVNQEAFGTNTTLPWGMISENTTAYLSSVQAALAAQGVTVDPSLPVHPTFLYESLWCLAGFILLALYEKHRRFHGEVMLMYVMWYGLGRFFHRGPAHRQPDDRPLPHQPGGGRGQHAGGAGAVAGAAQEIFGRAADGDIYGSGKGKGRTRGVFCKLARGSKTPSAAQLKEMLAAARAQMQQAGADENGQVPPGPEHAAQSGAAPEAQTEAGPAEAVQADEAAGYAAAHAAKRRTHQSPERWKRRKYHGTAYQRKGPCGRSEAARGAGVAALRAARHPVCLRGVFLVGDDAASATYVAGKERDCAECGITSQVVRLPADTPQAQLVARVQAASADSAVSGVLVQLPLPAHISEAAVIAAIAPHKDVDGFTSVNAGRMLLGQPCFVPCTPAGCLAMLRAANVPIAGRRAVVLGRSNIVGKPMALLLMRENATVTVCHSRTEGLAGVCREADILVAAVGRAGFVTADMVKPGAAVIDVGINRNAEGRLCGDVDFAAVQPLAGAISPVPGGVGLMTRAMLMENTLLAARLAAGQTA